MIYDAQYDPIEVPLILNASHCQWTGYENKKMNFSREKKCHYSLQDIGIDVKNLL